MVGNVKQIHDDTKKILDGLSSLTDNVEREAYIHRNTIKVRCGYTVTQDIAHHYNQLKAVSIQRRYQEANKLFQKHNKSLQLTGSSEKKD